MAPTIDPAVLGSILILQSSLQAAPDNKRLSELVCYTLTNLPGIHAAAFYLDDLLVAQDFSNPDHNISWPENRELDPEPKGIEELAQSELSVRTHKLEYGCILLAVSDQKEIQDYLPYFENTANLIALVIENRAQEKSLQDINANLEEQVRQRVKSLKQSEERLGLSLVVSRSGIWDWNLKTGEVFFGPNYFRISGYESDEFPHAYEEWKKRVHPDDIDLVVEKVQEFLAGDSSIFSVEFRFKKKDGSWMWLLGQGMIFDRDKDGAPVRFTGTHTDISERKQAQQEREQLRNQLIQAQKMESLGTLAGGIAHDFNNILAAVLGYTELVIDDLPGNSVHKASLQAVIGAANRARDLTRQILMFSRKDPKTKEAVRIGFVVKEAIDLLQQTIPSSVRLKVEISQTAIYVSADPTELHQIVINLCTNAYHALNNEEGEVFIGLEPQDVNGEMAARYPSLSEGRFAVITIRDDGSGMDQETLARIFEPFYTTKEPGKGTGMGLSVVHGIVQSYGGTIGVESTPGKGTTFKIFLPTTDIEIAEGQIAKKEAPTQGSGKILFVDDEPALASLGQQFLESLGFEVFATVSPVEALEKFSADPEFFDLIISDQTMPEISGDALAAEAMKIRPGIPIIICTGHSTVLDAEKAHAMGISAFLMKPYERTKLASIVLQVMDQSIGRSRSSDSKEK